MLAIFDVNETLSDMSPLAGRFASVLGPGEAPAELARVWFASVLRDGFAFAVTGEYRSFSSLGASVLRGVLAGRPLEVDPDEAVEQIMSAFSSLEVHPDVVAGVAALRQAGHRLVTLSNGSASVAEGLLGRAGVRDSFEALLSVDDAGLWKPARLAYEYALERCRASAEDAVLVAVHPWDLHGAGRAGLRTAWLDRQGVPYPDGFEPPTWRIGAVGDLAAKLAAGLGE